MCPELCSVRAAGSVRGECGEVCVEVTSVEGNRRGEVVGREGSVGCGEGGWGGDASTIITSLLAVSTDVISTESFRTTPAVSPSGTAELIASLVRGSLIPSLVRGSPIASLVGGPFVREEDG